MKHLRKYIRNILLEAPLDVPSGKRYPKNFKRFMKLVNEHKNDVWIFFDTETTGLPEKKNQSIYQHEKWPYIIQLSYIVYCTNDSNIISLENDYIKIPEHVNISEESQKIHKITNNMIERCWAKVIPQ